MWPMQPSPTAPAAMATLPSRWGPVVVAATARGVCGVELGRDAAQFATTLARRLTGLVVVDGPAAPEAARRHLADAELTITARLAGRPAPHQPPLDWTGVSAWDRRVLEGAASIRRGELTSYGRLARSIGAPGAARATGAALGRNPFWILVPCHRVVAGDGSLGGYGNGPDALEIKRELLALEGTNLPMARVGS